MCQPSGTYGPCVCRGSDDDMGGADQGNGGRKRIFVTRTRYTGDLRTAGGMASSIASADRLCNRAAEAAGLGGTWTAWLSDEGHSAIDRITAAGPWYLLDGTKAFNNRESLRTLPLAPIRITETGEALPERADETEVWTGTSVGGARRAQGSCRNWTDAMLLSGGIMGYAHVTDSRWMEFAFGDCRDGMRLYCLEQ